MNDILKGLSPYNLDWRMMFEKEAALLKQVFGDSALEIEHIGSTAVEGLPAKPIIDIAVMIQSDVDADRFTVHLAEIGYTFHSKSTERHFYQKGEPTHYNLSIAYAEKGGFWPRQIMFRDYLRAYSDARDDYAALKTKLIGQFPEGVGEYSEGKTEFVRKILALAGWKDGLTYRDWKSAR